MYQCASIVIKNSCLYPDLRLFLQKKLNSTNRWFVMEKQLNWDKLVGHYTKNQKNQKTGANSINARVVIGSMIIKHHSILSDEEQ